MADSSSIGPIRLRGGTKEAWEKCDPVLLYREPSLLYDDDEYQVIGIKFGDDVHRWSELPFFSAYPYTILENKSLISKPEALIYEPLTPGILLCDTTKGPVQIDLSPNGTESLLDIQIMDIGGQTSIYPIIINGINGALINKQDKLVFRSPYVQTRAFSIPQTHNWAVATVDLGSDVKIDWINIVNRPVKFPPEQHAATHGAEGDDPIILRDLAGQEVDWSDVRNKPEIFPTDWLSVANKPTGYNPPPAVLDRISANELAIKNIQQSLNNLNAYSLGDPDWTKLVRNLEFPYTVPKDGYLLPLLDTATVILLDSVTIASTGANTSYRAFLPVQTGQVVSIVEGDILESTFVPSRESLIVDLTHKDTSGEGNG